MNARITILMLLLALVPGLAHGQTTVVGPNGATPYTLETLSGADPFRAASNGLTLQADNTATTTNTALHSNIGFSYLRPYWASSGQALRVASGNNPAVAVVAPLGDLTRNYGFVPRLDLAYALAEVELGASFQYLAIGGNLNRTVTLDAGNANLISSYDLSILSINPIELSKPFGMTELSDHDLIYRLGLDNDAFVASISLRYETIRQSYQAALQGSSNAVANSNAIQNFNGLGLTFGLTHDHPLSTHWGLYSISRTSMLLGQNTRNSTSTGTGGNGPYSNTLNETKTSFFPVEELEIGLRYLTPLSNRAATETAPLLSLRVGFVGQFYSGIGFLPAASGTTEFDNRDLWLAGFSVLAGLIY